MIFMIYNTDDILSQWSSNKSLLNMSNSIAIV